MGFRLLGMAGIFFFSMLPLSATQDAPRSQSKETGSQNPPDAAVITDSGSTNAPGYRLVVYPSQAAEWTFLGRRSISGCSQGAGKLSPELTQRLFQDLRDLMPLSKLPVGHCAKSVSFGSTVRVRYGGTESPDLTCPAGGIEGRKLLGDLTEIERELGIGKNRNGLSTPCKQAAPAPIHE